MIHRRWGATAGFGLSTQILPSGYPLNTAQCHRLTIARGLIDHPRTLYVDFTLDALSSDDALAVWRGIKQYSTDTTQILATVRNEIAALADSVLEPNRDPQE